MTTVAVLVAIPTDAEDYAPRAEMGNLNAPLRLKCIDDRIEVKPADMEYWGVASYSWQIFFPRTATTEAAVQPIAEDTRIRIDKRTGGSLTLPPGLVSLFLQMLILCRAAGSSSCRWPRPSSVPGVS